MTEPDYPYHYSTYAAPGVGFEVLPCKHCAPGRPCATFRGTFDPVPGTDATMFIQWKGTDVCFDFQCPCQPEEFAAHFDGYYAYYVQCPACGSNYELGTQVRARLVEDTDGHEVKILDMEHTDLSVDWERPDGPAVPSIPEPVFVELCRAAWSDFDEGQGPGPAAEAWLDEIAVEFGFIAEGRWHAWTTAYFAHETRAAQDQGRPPQDAAQGDPQLAVLVEKPAQRGESMLDGALVVGPHRLPGGREGRVRASGGATPMSLKTTIDYEDCWGEDGDVVRLDVAESTPGAASVPAVEDLMDRLQKSVERAREDRRRNPSIKERPF